MSVKVYRWSMLVFLTLTFASIAALLFKTLTIGAGVTDRQAILYLSDVLIASVLFTGFVFSAGSYQVAVLKKSLDDSKVFKREGLQ